MRKKLLTYGRHTNEKIAYRIGKLIEREQNQDLEVYKWHVSYRNNFDLLLLSLRMTETFLIKIFKRPSHVYDLHQANVIKSVPLASLQLIRESTPKSSITEDILTVMENAIVKQTTIETVDDRNNSTLSDKDLETHRKSILDIIYERPNPNVLTLP